MHSCILVLFHEARKLLLQSSFSLLDLLSALFDLKRSDVVVLLHETEQGVGGAQVGHLLQLFLEARLERRSVHVIVQNTHGFVGLVPAHLVDLVLLCGQLFLHEGCLDRIFVILSSVVGSLRNVLEVELIRVLSVLEDVVALLTNDPLLVLLLLSTTFAAFCQILFVESFQLLKLRLLQARDTVLVAVINLLGEPEFLLLATESMPEARQFLIVAVASDVSLFFDFTVHSFLARNEAVAVEDFIEEAPTEPIDENHQRQVRLVKRFEVDGDMVRITRPVLEDDVGCVVVEDLHVTQGPVAEREHQDGRVLE